MSNVNPIDKFLEENPQCEEITKDNFENQLDDICGGGGDTPSASESGAQCGAIQIIGGGESPVCENSAANQMKQAVENIKDCQKALYEFTITKTLSVLIENNNNLIDSLMLQDQIFQTRLNMFQNELNTDIIILNVISAYNFIALLILIVFLMVIKNFR